MRKPHLSAWRRLSLACCSALGAGLFAVSAPALAAVAPTVGGESVSNVASDSATLAAQINPEGADTSYRFEYGTAAGLYTASAPIPDADAGAEEAGRSVSVHVHGLTAGTVYHYRVVARSEVAAADGSDETFTTQPLAGGPTLPDGRAYELVSPPEKHGAEALGIATPGAASVLAQAAAEGDAITYGMHIPPEVDPPSAPLAGVNILSRRGTDGWTSENISPPLHVVPILQEATSNFYRMFSPDLKSSILAMPGDTNAEPTLPFVHDGGGFHPLIAGKFIENEYVTFAGASPDLSHVALAGGYSSVAVGERQYVYEWSAGGIQLVSVLANGEQVAGVLGDFETGNSANAVSDDGSRIIWTARETHALYERDVTTGETTEVGHGNDAVYQAASSDGLKVFSTTDAASGGISESDLYVYDVVAGHLVDLAPTGAVLGVLGTGEAGSAVYFVAEGVLKDSRGQPLRNAAGGEPVAGAPNLYVSQEHAGVWSPRFLGTLTEGDRSDWNEHAGGLSRLTARVSPDGQMLAFMSAANLAGDDNLDANTGQPDTEVYLYDDATDQLRCASCNPTRARPTGRASVPGWTDATFGGQAYYQSRYLDNDGRLFFDSTDALVAQDTNGREDVYEFEPDSVGSCAEVTGCVGLISGGVGNGDSQFVDASATGDDVFFRTQEQNSPADLDNAYDIYDAHVCTTAAPCAPQPTATAPTCGSSDACKTAPTSQPTLFGPPPSATFAGAGNLAPAHLAASVKPKAKKVKKKIKKKPRKKSAHRAKKSVRRNEQGRR